MPGISVCLTHYNRPEKLAATLESLAGQTRQPDEVFLWDDCSPEDPTAVVRQFEGRFPHFVYHRNELNLNMPGNLNAVLVQATGDYIANLHDADTFAPTLLEKWESALIRHPSAGLVFSGVDEREPETNDGLVWLHPVDPLTSGREFFEKHFVGCYGSMIWGTVMVRREIYRKLLPFDPVYRNWADVDMWMRICLQADIAYVREALIVLDRSPTQQRRFTWFSVIVMQAMVLANIERAYAREPSRLKRLRGQQISLLRRRFVRHLLASIVHRDSRRWCTGCRIAGSVIRGDLSQGFLDSLWRSEFAYGRS